MAINEILIHWVLDLERRHKILSESTSIVDLGPQDLMPSARKFLAINDSNFEKEELFARDWYASLGLTKYDAFDIKDPRARMADFNNVLDIAENWDLVTNFGTSEHIFDQRSFMKNCHNFSKVGGVSLHCIPASGGMNHGLFNYHPSFFRTLAKANSYEILDFRYYPFLSQQEWLNQTNGTYVNLEKTHYYSDKREIVKLFVAKIKLVFKLRNILLFTSPKKIHYNFFSGDYIFVALRKNLDTEFANLFD